MNCAVLRWGVHHAHLIEPGTRKLLCTCDACAILFSATGAKYKRLPRRVLSLAHFYLSDGQWEGLMVPINMVFFFHSTPDARVVAFYPSPAGATESLLELETWRDIEDANPILKEMESDVEALLVNRVGHARGFGTPESTMSSHRRVLQAGRLDSSTLEGALGRGRSLAGDRQVLRFAQIMGNRSRRRSPCLT